MENPEIFHSLVFAPCPICGCSKDSPRILCPMVLSGNEPVYQLVECPECRTRRLNPLPSQRELDRFYAPYYYGSDWFKQEAKGFMFGNAMLPAGPSGKFLDVGCGLGFFLEGVRRSSSWKAYGVEISPEAASFAREKLNLDVYCGELPSAGFPDRFFDYLHVNNVLEHVLDPPGFLRECRRILQPGGFLYLSVPNGPADSANMIRFYLSEGMPSFCKSGHLFYFSRYALRHLFRESCFDIASSRTYGIRRGLSALGRYPQKPGWKKHYRPRPVMPAATPIILPPKKRRFPGYYAYRFRQARLKMLPGLWNIGLDFEIILKAL
jgi:SAM-dependent methyltransferase